jgi:predicted nucleic acid-binding protein
MSTPVVVDASVAYKWLYAISEHLVDEANDLLQRHLAGEIMLVAPANVSAEVANALRSKPRVSPTDVVGLIGDLDTIDITLVDVTYTRLSAATELAYRHNLSVYDALFLQLAEELECPLVTADRKAFAGIDSPVEIRLL